MSQSHIRFQDRYMSSTVSCLLLMSQWIQSEGSPMMWHCRTAIGLLHLSIIFDPVTKGLCTWVQHYIMQLVISKINWYSSLCFSLSLARKHWLKTDCFGPSLETLLTVFEGTRVQQLMCYHCELSQLEEEGYFSSGRAEESWNVLKIQVLFVSNEKIEFHYRKCRIHAY